MTLPQCNECVAVDLKIHAFKCNPCYDNFYSNFRRTINEVKIEKILALKKKQEEDDLKEAVTKYWT